MTIPPDDHDDDLDRTAERLAGFEEQMRLVADHVVRQYLVEMARHDISRDQRLTLQFRINKRAGYLARSARNPFDRVRTPAQAEREMVEVYLTNAGSAAALHKHAMFVDRVMNVHSPVPGARGGVEIQTCATPHAFWYRLECLGCGSVLYVEGNENEFVRDIVIPWLSFQSHLPSGWVRHRRGMRPGMVSPGGIC